MAKILVADDEPDLEALMLFSTQPWYVAHETDFSKVTSLCLKNGQP